MCPGSGGTCRRRRPRRPAPATSCRLPGCPRSAGGRSTAGRRLPSRRPRAGRRRRGRRHRRRRGRGGSTARDLSRRDQPHHGRAVTVTPRFPVSVVPRVLIVILVRRVVRSLEPAQGARRQLFQIIGMLWARLQSATEVSSERSLRRSSGRRRPLPSPIPTRPTLVVVRSPRDFFRPLAVGAPRTASRDPLPAEPDDPLLPTPERQGGRQAPRHRADRRRAARQPRRRHPGQRQGGRTRRPREGGQRPSTSARRSCGRGSTASIRHGASTIS